jgi:hypothetical protein
VLNVDTCDRWDKFRQRLKDDGQSEEEMTELKKLLHAHLIEANKTYTRRTKHIADCQAEWGTAATTGQRIRSIDKTVVQVQDAAGNLRTPRPQCGEAYYKRLLPVWVYDFYNG